MARAIVSSVMMGALALAHQPAAGQGHATLDVAAIEQALGRKGQTQDGVYKVSAPRSDLKVSVGGVAVRPGLALGSWMAFRAAGGETVAHGDLVLLEQELNPVISALQAGGFDITAVHNHVIGETPRIMYVHFWGRGDAAALAKGLRAALDKTATPAASPASPESSDAMPGWIEGVSTALGRKGTYRGGVLSVSVPRPETITMMGVELPPSMGMATAINVQEASSGRVAATGDFVMVGDEVNAVARALRGHGIEITALHNHMIHGSPELYFMHFWATGSPAGVGAGLRAALDAMSARR